MSAEQERTLLVESVCGLAKKMKEDQLHFFYTLMRKMLAAEDGVLEAKAN